MAKIEANWTEADMAQAELMVVAHPGGELYCSNCGDGREPNHDLCTACEKKQAAAKPSPIPQDNWRQGARFPRRGRRRYG